MAMKIPYSTPDEEEAMARQPAWKERLEPFGHLYWTFENAVMRLCEAATDEELAQLLLDCERPSPSNIWYATYHAAPIIKNRVLVEQKNRRDRAAAGVGRRDDGDETGARHRPLLRLDGLPALPASSVSEGLQVLPEQVLVPLPQRGGLTLAMSTDQDLTWVEQTKTVDAIDSDVVTALEANPGWQLLHVGIGSGGQTTLTYGWPWNGSCGPGCTEGDDLTDHEKATYYAETGRLPDGG